MFFHFLCVFHDVPNKFLNEYVILIVIIIKKKTINLLSQINENLLT